MKNVRTNMRESRTRRVLRWIIILPLRSLGWLAWILLIFAAFMQGSNYGQHELEGLLRRRLDPLGSSVSLAGVRFDWLGPGLTVQELRVEKNGREHLYLQNIYVSAHFGFDGGVTLDRIDIDRGSLLISEEAIADVRALVNSGSATGTVKSEPLQLPAVEIRAFDVRFETPDRGSARLGEIELSMQSHGAGYSRILGRVRLPRAAGEHATPELALSGLVDSNGLLELHTVIENLDLASWDVPALPAFDVLRALNPSGRVSLHTTGSVQLDGELAPRGDLRLLLEDGGLQVPGTSEPVKELQIAFQASFRPAPEQSFWTPAAWRGGARLNATWDGQQIRAGVRIGQAARPGLALESWLQTPYLLVDTPALAAMQSPQLLPTLFGALDPAGRVNARFAIAIPEPSADEPATGAEYVVRVDNVEPLTAAYYGWPDPLHPDVPPMSFPMPATVDDANVIFAYTPRFPRPNLLDVRFRGSHRAGPIDGSYQSWPNPIDMPPFAQGFGLSEGDLVVHVPRLALDDDLDGYLQGLDQLPAVMRIFEDYGIEAGTVAAKLRLCWRKEFTKSAVELQVEAHQVFATYADLPVPAQGMNGTVHFVDGGLGKSAIGFNMRGRTSSAKGLHVAGRVRSEQASAEERTRPTRFGVYQVDVQSFDLEGSDLGLIGSALPDVQEAVAEFDPHGSVQFQSTRTSRLSEDILSWTEVSPLGANFHVRPTAFPMDSGNVRGRVIVDVQASDSLVTPMGPEPPVVRTRTRISPLLATWKSQVLVGFHGEFNSTAASTGRVVGAALPGLDRELIDDLLHAAEIDSSKTLEDLRGMTMNGAVDFEYGFDIPHPEALPITGYDLHFRDVEISDESGLHISELRGDLVYAENRVRSRQLSARLGGTPFRLTSVELNRTPTGFVVQADLGRRRLQIAPELLEQFLDKETTKRLFEEFELRGTLDLESGHVSIEVPENAPLKIRLSGEATLSDAYMALGLPVSVRSARVRLEDVILEGDDLRGWGRIEDLYGQILGRDLAQTNLLLSYHGSQITVEEFEGNFCRGTVRGLGAGGERDLPAPVLTLDLLPPYAFRAGLRLSDVEVRLLLEDVFSSGIADRGWLDGQFQLVGDLENLFDIRGSGRGRVSQTILWSVPVLRDLFGQLGLDETAIFDAMETDFEIENGEIKMEGMYVHSPLIKLRGAGVMGFDGKLKHDLELRYSLVEGAGPFGDIIHWLQNRLLGISIRGDMSRPKVLLRGVFSNPFTDLDDNWRALPAPGYTPLPARF